MKSQLRSHLGSFSRMIVTSPATANAVPELGRSPDLPRVPSRRGGRMTASIGPTVRRRRLGTELRRLREAHSIKLEEVAEKLGLATSTLSRIETGKAPTRTAYLSAMLDLYGVNDPGGRQILVDMARDGHRKGWWAAWEDVLPTGFDVYVGLEAEAASLRAYESLVVHGLLQTEAYARVVMTTVRRRQTPEQIER